MSSFLLWRWSSCKEWEEDEKKRYNWSNWVWLLTFGCSVCFEGEVDPRFEESLMRWSSPSRLPGLRWLQMRKSWNSYWSWKALRMMDSKTLDRERYIDPSCNPLGLILNRKLPCFAVKDYNLRSDEQASHQVSWYPCKPKKGLTMFIPGNHDESTESSYLPTRSAYVIPSLLN